MTRLRGLSTVITGASSGIGEAIAERFVAEGALVTMGSRTEPAVAGAAWVKTDVAVPADADALIAAAVGAHGRLDVLVNNAGVQVEKTVAETTDEDFEFVMDVNVKGVFNCARAAVRQMQSQDGGGAIINIGSVAGNTADHGMAVYNASKGAVHALTRAIAIDHGKDRIRCNAIAPGWIATALADAAFELSADPVAARQRAVSKHPVGRLGLPADISSLAVWLASDEAAFASGSVFTIDGGLTAQSPITPTSLVAMTDVDTWHKTICILCSNNCGVEVRLDGREITRVRGNKAHVASKGYTCEKALRLNHYQNAQGRLTSPMKRLPDGSYIEVEWDSAIAEIAASFMAIGSEYGQDKVMYYGGGGQGNHLGGVYGASTRNALGITRRSNALAQEKTGEAWVEGRMFGTHTHGHFADAEVSIFLGENPWHSHGFDETRRVLKEIAKDDSRSMVVIDPRRTETADLADFHLAPNPGTDAFLLAAIGAVLVTEDLTADAWLAQNVHGAEETMAAFAAVPIGDYAQRCGVSEDQIRAVARRMGVAKSVAVYEDLGIEMAPHSTLVSWIQRALWVLVGSYGVHGGMSAHSSIVPLFSYSASGAEPTTPVTGGPIVSGLTPCNEIADGILSDHPERNRALLIESANPVHSLAGSAKFRQAMRECELSVVIDVFFTETAAQSDWVLPASSQYEKVETTFFNLAFPENKMTVRAPILEPLSGTLSEPEIHSRLVQALGVVTEEDFAPLRAAAKEGMDEFSAAFMAAAAAKPELAGIGGVVLYETLGKGMLGEMAAAAPLWFSAQQLAMKDPEAVRAAGHTGVGPELGNSLFNALVTSRDGVVITKHELSASWDLLRTPDHKINLGVPEMISEMASLVGAPTDYRSDEFPFVLSAGERRGFTANTIMRDPEWRKRDAEGALRLSPTDAARLGVETGDRIRVSTPGGTAVAVAEVNETMLDGHISLPNGMGLGYSPAGGEPELTGVAPNELTTTDWKDPIVGTPWHKHVPAKLEAVAR